MKQFSYTLSVICLLLIGAVWVRAQTLGPAGGVLISGGSFTSGDVICGAGGASVQDCGASTGTVGALNITSTTPPTNGFYLNSANVLGFEANGTQLGFWSVQEFAFSTSANRNQILAVINANAGTATQSQLWFGNSSSNSEATLSLNGGSFSGGHGANALTLTSAGLFYITGGSTDSIEVDASGNPYLLTSASDATKTDATVCRDTTSGELYHGSGAAGICLGTSAARFKHDIRALDVGLAQIMKLEAVSYKLNEGYGDPNKILYGFTADQGGTVLPLLMGKDPNGRPNSFDYVGVIPVLVKAVQEQQLKIVALERRLRDWHVHR